MSDRSSSLNILDCPDEVLKNIVSNLNARERVSLSQTSARFNTLIFDDKSLFRDLDFSEEGYLASESDVKLYFEDETKLEYIFKINVSSVYCRSPGEILQTISKATNLVEVNISGFRMKNFQEFAQFLDPLKQLKKFTGDWPTGMTWRNSPWIRYFKESFGRLTHLSITLHGSRDKWSLIDALELCLELEELYLLQAYRTPESKRRRFWMYTLNVLDKLNKVVCCGCEAGLFLTLIMDLLGNPLEWAKLWPSSNSSSYTEYFCLEKNLEVAEELRDNVMLRYDMFQPDDYIGWHLQHERLLREVLELNTHLESKKLCFSSISWCSLRIKDAELLLKNPRYQIPYLNLVHDIDPECEAHLIASIFPILTKLVLSNIITGNDWTLDEPPFKTGIKRKRSVSGELSKAECSNTSFKKLVDNTPDLQDLTLCASSVKQYKNWDLAALYQITRWKKLKVLSISHVPITDGQFLVEIAKQCTNLEKLRLEDLGPRILCCYKNELLEMLGHCLNLKDFSIQQNNVNGVSDIFHALAKVPKLRRVRVESLGRKKGIGKIPAAIEQLFRSRNLILLICEVKGMTQIAADELSTMLQRLKDEFKRPLFQFEIRLWNRAKEPSYNLDLDFAHRDLVLPQRLTDAIYRLNFL